MQDQENKNIISETKNDTSNIKSKNKIDLFPGVQNKLSAYSTNGNVRSNSKISIFNPLTFDEALDIVECLRDRGATTICLESMKKFDANRLVDFVAGASKALDGDFHKLSDQVYLFSPSNIKITAQKDIAKTNDDLTTGFDFIYNDKLNMEKPIFNKPWLSPR